MDIIIRKDKVDYYIFIDKKDNKYIFSGYDSNGNKLDKNIIKLLSFFQLSINSTKLNNNQTYDIYKDNQTGLIHFVKDGYDNLNMLISYNGKNAVQFSINDEDLDKKRMTFAKKLAFLGIEIILLTTISIEAISLYCATSNIHKQIPVNYTREIVINEDEILLNNSNILIPSIITIDDIVSYINSSNNLNDQEKEFLINNNFFYDMLPYINDSMLEKVLTNRLKDLELVSYDKSETPSVAGYYSGSNKLYIGNYDRNYFYRYTDTIAHEFIHLFQYAYDENYIIEGLAEIISFEYYGVPINSYHKEVRNVKLLIDVIGRDAVLDFAFNNNIHKLNSYLAPYLNEDDIKIFDEIITEYDPLEANIKVDHDTLLEIIKKAYLQKYGKSFDIDYVENIDDTDLCQRYYFNSMYCNDPNYNYYITTSNVYHTLEEAIDMEIVSIQRKEIAIYEYDDYINNHMDEPLDYYNILNYVKVLNPDIEIEMIFDDGFVDWESNTIIMAGDKLYFIILINGERTMKSADELIELGDIEFKVPVIKFVNADIEEYNNATPDQRKNYIIKPSIDTVGIKNVNGKIVIYEEIKNYLPLNDNNLSK